MSIQARANKVRVAAALILGCALATATAGRSQAPGGKPGPNTPVAGEPLPNFDIAARGRGAALTARPASSSVSGALPALPKGTVVKFDGLTGAANRLYRLDRNLTPPTPGAPDLVARRFIAGNPSLFGQTQQETAALIPTYAYRSPEMKAVHLTYGQSFNGIPVVFSELKIDLTDTGEVLIASGAVVPRLGQTLNAVTPRLTPGQALAAAMRYAGMPAAPTVPLGEPVGPRREITFAAGNGLSAPPVLKLSYLNTAPGRTTLAWDTRLLLTAVPDVYRLLVDARTGDLLRRYNETAYAHGQIFAEDGPLDTSPVPAGAPANLARVDETFDGGRDFNGSPLFGNADAHFDWWAGAAKNKTQGNNVIAGLARDQQNFPPFVPTAINANPGEDFTFAANLALEPTTYRNATVANLFYWNNRLHDIWHKFGFNEAARNFQTNNFGQGGLGNDAVQALAQYGADTIHANNANMSTPSDGSPPTMRMFEWTLTAPRRDSDFDNGVIAHEYGHGVTNRLVGNGGGLNSFQSGAMGEGWSDFQALMVLAEQGDDRDASHTVGAYVTNNVAAGIRTQPYSTNKNGAVYHRTFYNIGDAFGFNGAVGQVHNAGEIMGNTMWNVYTRIVARLGFVNGRNRTMALFIAGLKLTPLAPTFLDWRDALLLADRNGFAGADEADIWAAFAAQGMGVGAATPASNSSDTTESFEVPGFGISGKVKTAGGAGIAGVAMKASGPGRIVTSVTESPGLAIPDPGILERTLNVAQAGTVAAVKIPVNITHPFRGDVVLRLRHLGREVILCNVAFFDRDSRDNVARTFETTLFNGMPMAGDWTLVAQDGDATEAGVLNSWGLDIGRAATIDRNLNNNGDGTYAFTNLPPGGYTVTATKAGSNFAPRNVTIGPEATNIDFIEGGGDPVPPTGVNATASDDELEIVVTWADVGATNTGYRVERAQGAGGPFQTLLNLGDVTTHTDTSNLLGGTLYRYRVFTLQGAQVSPASAIAEATTIAANAGKLQVAKQLNFQLAKLRKIKKKALTIKNTAAQGNLAVTLGALASPFGYETPPQNPIIIPAGGQVKVNILFKPTNTRKKTVNLKIQSSDPNRPNATVKCIGQGKR